MPRPQQTPVFHFTRVEHRECLVSQLVPCGAFSDVVLKSEARTAPVRALVARGGHPQRVSVQPDWYF